MSRNNRPCSIGYARAALRSAVVFKDNPHLILVRGGREITLEANMNAVVLQEPVLKLKGPATDCTLPGKTFIWLPFAGGISAFSVILPKPMGTGDRVVDGYPDASHVNGLLRVTGSRQSGSPPMGASLRSIRHQTPPIQE
jgi:hypothetical protein